MIIIALLNNNKNYYDDTTSIYRTLINLCIKYNRLVQKIQGLTVVCAEVCSHNHNVVDSWSSFRTFDHPTKAKDSDSLLEVLSLNSQNNPRILIYSSAISLRKECGILKESNKTIAEMLPSLERAVQSQETNQRKPLITQYTQQLISIFHNIPQVIFYYIGASK